MKVQAEEIMKNAGKEQLLNAADRLITAARYGRGQDGFDDVYMLVVARTPSPRQSPIDLPITAPRPLDE